MDAFEQGRRRCGYTLMELCVVVLIIAVVMGIAAPRLLPAISYSRLDTAARHLAGYGMAALAHCALEHDRLIVIFDLDTQEYWAVRRLKQEGDLFSDEENDEEDKDEGLFTDTEEAPDADESIATKLAYREDNATEEMARRAEEHFQELYRDWVEARSEVLREDGLLSDIDPLFEGVSLDLNPEEKREEILAGPLERVRLPDKVHLVSVELAGQEHSGGQVEIRVTQLGLGSQAVFLVANEQGEEIRVVWDPITGNGRVENPLGRAR